MYIRPAMMARILPMENYMQAFLTKYAPKTRSFFFFQIPISSFPPGFFILKMLPQQGRNPEVNSDSFSVLIFTS